MDTWVASAARPSSRCIAANGCSRREAMPRMLTAAQPSSPNRSASRRRNELRPVARLPTTSTLVPAATRAAAISSSSVRPTNTGTTLHIGIRSGRECSPAVPAPSIRCVPRTAILSA